MKYTEEISANEEILKILKDHIARDEIEKLSLEHLQKKKMKMKEEEKSFEI